MSSDSVNVAPDRLPAGRRLSLTRAIRALATGRGSGSRGAGGITDSCISDALANANTASIGTAIIAPRGVEQRCLLRAGCQAAALAADIRARCLSPNGHLPGHHPNVRDSAR